MNPDETSEALERAAVAAYHEGGWFGWGRMGAQRCPHRGTDLMDDFLSFHWSIGYAAGRHGPQAIDEPLWTDWADCVWINAVDPRTRGGWAAGGTS